MFSILRPYIFSLDPEVAHDLAIKSLKANFLPKSLFDVAEEEMLETKLFNKKLPNPIGLAAGFDKSAEVYNSLFKFGFGFIEVGTVTPKRQLGNPKPRIFRLEKDQALINRLGFNNHGSEIIFKRISENQPDGFLGINIGPNKDTKNKEEDYFTCLSRLSNDASYITINISSPNTEGLRNFHNQEEMKKLLVGLNKIKKEKKIEQPIAIKFSRLLSVVLDTIIPCIFWFLTNSTIRPISSSPISGEILIAIGCSIFFSFLILFNPVNNLFISS